MNFTFYAGFIGKINQTLADFANNTAVDVMDSMRPFFRICLTLYIIQWAYRMMYGMIQESWADGFKTIFKLVTVYAIATNINLYNDFFAD